MIDVQLVIVATCTLGAAGGVAEVRVVLLLPQPGPCGTGPECRDDAEPWSTIKRKHSAIRRAQPFNLLRHSNAKDKE
jgi:hypothetical protein